MIDKITHTTPKINGIRASLKSASCLLKNSEFYPPRHFLFDNLLFSSHAFIIVNSQEENRRLFGHFKTEFIKLLFGNGDGASIIAVRPVEVIGKAMTSLIELSPVKRAIYRSSPKAIPHAEAYRVQRPPAYDRHSPVSALQNSP